MADMAEDDKLRKQIAFLTNLIDSATPRDSSSHQNVPYLNAKKHSDGLTANYSKCSQRQPYIVKNQRRNNQTTIDKYSWSKTKGNTFRNSRINAKASANVVYHEALNTAMPVTNNYVPKVSQVMPSANNLVDTRTQTVSTVANKISIPKSLSLDSKTYSSSSLATSSHQPTLHKGDGIHNQAKSTSISSSHTYLQEQIRQTELKLQILKKDIEKRKLQSNLTSHPSSANAKENLQSLSPYKMKKVPVSGYSTTVLQKPVRKSDHSENEQSHAEDSYSDIGKRETETNKSAQVVKQSKSSLKTENRGLSLVQGIDSEQRKPTPSKLVLKTRYALKRERRYSDNKNGSAKGCSSKRTKTKYVSFSKYSLKRTRQSSFENEPKKFNNNFKSFNAAQTNSTQYATRVIRSKHKLQKVFRRQPQQQWSPRHRSFRAGQQYNSVFRRRGRHRGSAFHHQAKLPDYYYYYKQRSYFNRKDHKIYKGYGRGGKLHFVPAKRLPWKHIYSQHESSHLNNFNYIRRKMTWLKRNVPFDPKLKVDRRATSQHKGSAPVGMVDMVMVNGMLYKSSGKPQTQTPGQLRHHSSSKTSWSGIRYASANKMKTVSVRGVRFSVDSKGRKLTKLKQQNSSNASVSTEIENSTSGEVKRVDFGGITYVETEPGTLERLGSSQTRKVAMRVVNKTVARAASRNKKLVKRQYCMFYNRFGKCNKGSKCPYVHDPDKVAVCTRFLRGTCKIKECPFSHKVSKEKMPVCSYFLKGICNKDDCPYRHVNVSKDAEICYDFVKGYCPQGEKCKKKHILVCAEFAKTGSCKDGKKCKLQHRQTKRRMQSDNRDMPKQLSKESAACPSTDDKVAKNRTVEPDTIEPQVDDSHLPFKERKLPAYISLNLKKTSSAPAPSSVTSLGSSNTASMTTTVAAASSSATAQDKVIKIRPQL